MKERIDILVPDSILAENQQKQDRLERTMRFEPTDRVPVVVDCSLWTALGGRRQTFREMTSGPREHLRELILNFKWRCENIPDDLPIETRCLTVEPDFGALRGIEFPVEIAFQDDQPPKTIHLLNSPEEIDCLEIPEPPSGHYRLRVQWYQAMHSMFEDFDVRINGERLELRVALTHAGGPFPSAFALCGSNLFLWMATEPERVHRLMQIVTASHLRCVEYLDRLQGFDSRHELWLGGDTAEMVSPSMFREFAVPYYAQLWDHYPSTRALHMCGKIDHLLNALQDDLGITYLDGFGFPADRCLLAERLAGRVVLRGGPHPLLIRDGPVERIIEECRDYVRTVGMRGGYILSEGFGLAPGTPPEHITAMVMATRG